MLFLEPTLVRDAYRDAPHRKALPQTGRGSAADLEAMIKAAEAPDWAGYFGSPPRVASAALGAEVLRRGETYARLLAARILDGLDPRTLKRSEERPSANWRGRAPPISATCKRIGSANVLAPSGSNGGSVSTVSRVDS